MSGKRAQIAARTGLARVLLSLAIICALLIAPLFTMATHGPGSYAKAVAVAAEDIAHDYAHDFSADGSSSHDVTDHEHQSFAVNPHAEHLDPGEDSQDLFVAASFASGLERDGPRRPPRLLV